MVHNKVALELISNDATQHVTFKRWCKGLMKKASELAMLCNIKACIVVYSDGEVQPEVCPSIAKAMHILGCFMARLELDRYNKKMNQEGFLCQCIDKIQEQIHKANHESAATSLLQEALLGRHPCLANITIKELTSLSWMGNMHINNIMESIHQCSSHMATVAAFQSPTDQIHMAATYAATDNIDYVMKADPM